MGARWATALCATPLSERVQLVGLVDVDPQTGQRRFATPTGCRVAVVGADLAEVLAEAKPEIVFDVAVPAVAQDASSRRPSNTAVTC